MQKNRLSISLLLVALLAGCSSMPNQNILLAEARNDYAAAQNNPQVVQLASSELRNAGVALDQANAAFAASEEDAKVNQLAYLAKQQIATTQEVAKRKAAEQVVASAGKEREQLRLEQRTAEADKAKAELVSASADRERDQRSLNQKTAETERARADLAAANVGRDQDQLLLNQKTAEANQARMETGIAQNQAIDAQILSAEAEARTRQLEAMLAGLAAKETERGMVVTLNDVLFNIDQSQLKPDGMRNVQKLSEFMKQYPQRTVLIEGYTDSTGSSAHNMDLSNRRAEAVRAALESMGVARERMAARGYGEAYPIAANDTSGNRQLNRRVEIILSGDNGRVAAR